MVSSAGIATRLSLLYTRLCARWDGPCLTAREIEVARLVAKGLTNEAVGRCLSVSTNTIKAALKRIFAKLDVDSRAEMASRLHGAGWS
jgi:DNA-binding CsgD family transcriptional regulator